jgi:uncharacterized protein
MMSMKYPTRLFTGAKVPLCLVVAAALACPLLGATRTRNYSPFPQPDAGYVTDGAGLLSDEQEQQLEDWLLKTETGRGVEIVVVTINSIRDYPGTPNRDIGTFARALFDAYGIGNMPKNKGVLLLVAAGDRQAKIALGAGYGHARDRDARRITDRRITPSFRAGNYAEGITRGVRALMWQFGGVLLVPWWTKWALLGTIAGLILVAISVFRNGKRGWGWVVAGSIIVLVLALVWLLRHTLRAIPEGDTAPGGWGGWSGSGGGSGGFGGGFSGGGGATGSW